MLIVKVKAASGAGGTALRINSIVDLIRNMNLGEGNAFAVLEPEI